MNLGALEQLVFSLQLGGAHLLQVFFQALEPLFHLAKVGDDEVEVDVLDVAQRIDRPNMRDRRIVEDAHHMSQRIDIAQVGGEGGFLQSFLAEGGDVGVLDAGMHQLLGVVERGQAVEPVVGNFGDTEVRLARIARTLRDVLPGEHDEERSFAYLRQADDSGFHSVKKLPASSRKLPVWVSGFRYPVSDWDGCHRCQSAMFCTHSFGWNAGGLNESVLHNRGAYPRKGSPPSITSMVGSCGYEARNLPQMRIL